MSLGYKFKKLLRSIGLHRRTVRTSDGIKFRERSMISLRRALAETGPGVKEYEVKFPHLDAEGRRSMRIRYTNQRIYTDLGHDPRIHLYNQAIESIRPGMRTLELGCGTGGGSALLAQTVGPSGGVIAVDRDGESIRFARQRYRYDHCAFELGWIESVDGEINGAFEAVVCVDPLREVHDTPEGARVLIEIERVVRPGGVLIAIVSSPETLSQLKDGFEGMSMVFERELKPDPRSGWSGFVFRKPGHPESPINRDAHEPGPFRY